MPQLGDKVYAVLKNGKLNALTVFDEFANADGKPIYWTVRKRDGSHGFSVHHSEYHVTVPEAIAAYEQQLDAQQAEYLAKTAEKRAVLAKLKAAHGIN